MKFNIGQLRSSAIYLTVFALTALGTVTVVPLPSLGFTLPQFLVFSVAGSIGALLVILPHSRVILGALLGVLPGRLLLLYIAVIFLSIGWSIAPLMSLFGADPRHEGLLALTVAVMLALVAMHAAERAHSRRILLASIHTSNALVVLYGVLQMIHLDPFREFWMDEVFLGRTFSTLGNPNFLGLWLLLTAPFIALQAMQTADARRHLWGALLFLNLFVLLGTVSRSALLGLAGVTVVLLPWIKSWARSLVRRITPRQAFITALLIILLLSAGATAFRGRFSHSFAPPWSIATRTILWENATRAIIARPIGYGLETYGIVSPAFTGSDLTEHIGLQETIDRAHSQPLDLLLTLGPLGLVAYYAFLLTLLVAVHRRLKEARDQTSGILRAGAAALIGASIALLFGFHSMTTLMTMWIIAGMLLGLLSPLPEQRATPTQSSLASLFFSVLAFACVGAAATAALWTQSRIMRAHAETLSGSESYVALSGASDIFPYDRSLLLQISEKGLLLLDTAGAADPERHIDALDRLTGGHDGFVPLLRAWLAVVKDEGDANTDELLKRAQAMLPRSILSYRITLHIHELRGDKVAYRNTLEELRAVLPERARDPKSPAGRILRKENPWLQELE